MHLVLLAHARRVLAESPIRLRITQTSRLLQALDHVAVEVAVADDGDLGDRERVGDLGDEDGRDLLGARLDVVEADVGDSDVVGEIRRFEAPDLAKDVYGRSLAFPFSDLGLLQLLTHGSNCRRQ